MLWTLRVGVLSSINRITKKSWISRYQMAIVLLYSLCILSARCDSMWARCNLPFQFDKSWNLSFLSFSVLKTIIFNKFIVYYCFFYHFLSDFYQMFIIYYQISIEFYQILLFWDNRIRQRNFIALAPDLIIEMYNPVSCWQTFDRKKALSPTLNGQHCN